VIHTSGLRVWLLNSPSHFVSADQIDCDGLIQTPGVKTTRGAPSILHDPVYYNSGILSSMSAVNRNKQKRTWATPDALSHDL